MCGSTPKTYGMVGRQMLHETVDIYSYLAKLFYIGAFKFYFLDKIMFKAS